jgi:hypothetical protein
MDFKKYLIAAVLICWNFSFACKCREFHKETMVEKGLKEADIVFYGELIKSDSLDETFSFKIIELFKGKFSKGIINGFPGGGNCNLFPINKGLWIVYGNFNADNTMSMNICLPSQSLDFGPGYPAPPIIFENGKVRETTVAEYRLFDLEARNKSLTLWIYQLEKLRKHKLAQNTITKQSKSDLKDKIMIGLLIVNGFLLLTIIGMIVSKKSSNKRITK